MEFLSNDVDTWTNAQISIVMVCWLINFLPIIAAFWRVTHSRARSSP